MSTFAEVSAKLGDVDPETRAIAKELYDVGRANSHEIWFMWGDGGGEEHGSGNALDLMVRNEAAGDFLRNYIWTHRARLRLIHVIWEQHITSTRVQPGVRRKMDDRGDVTENHYDHIHVWFYPGPYRPLESATPTTKPKPTRTPITKPPAVARKVPVRTLYHRPGRPLVGRDVLLLQKGLKRVFPAYAGNLATDRVFGPDTKKKVMEFQRRTKLKRDGVVGPKTRAKLKQHGISLY